MTVIAIIGAKHSPGATTLALALASNSAMAEQRTLLVEADPAGGDIAARLRLSVDPGLLTLAAAGRHGITEPLLASHTQPLASGVKVLLAPPSPDQASTALAGIGPSLAHTVAQRDATTYVDVGRWDSHSGATEFVRVADVAVIVFRPTLEGVEHARVRIASLAFAGSPLLIAATVGERPYPPREVAAALGEVSLHVIAHDSRAANAVGAGAGVDRWLRRSSLLRSTAALSDRLHNSTRAVAAQ